ncbi:MAG: hypothetical protein LBB67_07495 [Oscillospiraceae bacterium]|jgi:hypothetical protein|nr:hypothetical protein [Oscillospiraceae bacterium]
MFDVLNILSNLFGFAAGTNELFAVAWGWLQLIVDSFGSIAESVTALIGG